MNTALTHVNRSAGRFGKPDSPDLCKAIIDQIPLEQLLAAKKVLDVACGYGGFAKAYVNRVEQYIGRKEAFNRIWLIDSYRGCTNFCQQRLGFKHVINADFLSWKPNMQFDVIIGNPPYQRPKTGPDQDVKHSHPMWWSFLELGSKLLAEGGYFSLLVPAAVCKSTRWNEPGNGLKRLSWANITAINTGLEDHFNVGTGITQVVATTGNQGLVLVNREIDWNLSERPWLPVDPSPLAMALMDRVSSQPNNFSFSGKLDPADAHRSFGLYRLNQDFGFSTQLTSERRTTKANGEPLKLMWFNQACESRAEAELLVALTHSRLFTAVRRLTFYEPNYAFHFLNGLTYPDNIPATDAETYRAYGLSAEEIEFVERQMPSTLTS